MPDGWACCGNLVGSAIPYYEGPIYPGYPEPFLCRFLPIGGQVEPIPNTNPDPPSHIFWGPGELIGSTYYGPSNGLLYKIAGEGAPYPVVQYSGGTTYQPQPAWPDVWFADPHPGQHLTPWRDQPHRPMAESPAMGPRRGNTVDSYRGYPLAPRPGPRPSRPAPGNPHQPPGPRTKERKGKVPPWFAKMAAAGFEVTEAVDLVQNLWGCLPKSVRKSTPKTGTTLPDAWRPGIKYSSAIDKAKHVYNNINDLDLDCAVKSIAMNHVTDALWGRFFGAVDDEARRRFLTAFGRAAGG
nr:MAG: hypothetical protein [Microvirus sp.]